MLNFTNSKKLSNDNLNLRDLTFYKKKQRFSLFILNSIYFILFFVDLKIGPLVLKPNGM